MANLNRIVVYSDLSPAAAGAIRLARTIARTAHAGLEMIRVVGKPLNSDWTSELSTAGMPAVQDAVETEAREWLSSVVGEHEADAVGLRVEIGGAAEEIARYVREERPDLVVFGLDREETEGDRLGAAQQLLASISCALLVVRDADAGR